MNSKQIILDETSNQSELKGKSHALLLSEAMRREEMKNEDNDGVNQSMVENLAEISVLLDLKNGFQ